MRGRRLKLLLAYLQSLFSVADRVRCSILESRSTIHMNLDVPTDDIAVLGAQGVSSAANGIQIDESNNLKSNHNGDTVMSIDTAGRVDCDSNPTWDRDIDSDSDFSSLYDCDEGCNTDETTVMQDLKKFYHSCIAISPSASLPIQLLRNPTWSL